MRLLALCLCVTTAAPAADILTIGDDAPPLRIEHWASHAEGFGPVTDFEDGRVYVIEFWATWCPPCRSSMPHLAELQNEYAAEGVQIVSVSREKLDTVQEFLTKPTKKDDEEAPTYGELTSAYSLSCDPDGSTSASYMTPAGRGGIPCAFIVGKEGLIEWIGHPMSMDRPLASVVSGTWDREAFKKSFLPGQLLDKLKRDVSRAAKAGDGSEVVRLVRQYEAEHGSGEQTRELLMSQLTASGDGNALATTAAELLADESDPADAVGLAQTLIGPLSKAKVSKASYAKLRKAVEAAELEGPQDADRQRTVAVLYLLAGDVRNAKKWIGDAVKTAKPDEALSAEVEETRDKINAASRR